MLKYNLFLWVKAEFSSLSYDPSEIILICWFDAQETFLYYYDYWKQLCCFMFVRKPTYILFVWFFNKYKVKNSIYFKHITELFQTFGL